MKKTLSRQELITMSLPVFNNHNTGVLYATLDGQFFIVKDRAQMHARNTKSETVYEIARHEAIGSIEVKEQEPVTGKTNPVLEGNLKDIAEAVSKMSNKAILEALLAEEQQGEDRKGAKEAIEKQIEALEAKSKDDGNNNK